MYCIKCGKQIPDDSQFCPYCGENQQTEQFREECFNQQPVVEVPRKATFKEGTKALFNKFFVFNGRTSRSEFNYGLLFIMLIVVQKKILK